MHKPSNRAAEPVRPVETGPVLGARVLRSNPDGSDAVVEVAVIKGSRAGVPPRSLVRAMGTTAEAIKRAARIVKARITLELRPDARIVAGVGLPLDFEVTG